MPARGPPRLERPPRRAPANDLHAPPGPVVRPALVLAGPASSRPIASSPFIRIATVCSSHSNPRTSLGFPSRGMLSLARPVEDLQRRERDEQTPTPVRSVSHRNPRTGTQGEEANFPLQPCHTVESRTREPPNLGGWCRGAPRMAGARPAGPCFCPVKCALPDSWFQRPQRSVGKSMQSPHGISVAGRQVTMAYEPRSAGAPSQGPLEPQWMSPSVA